MPNIDWSYHRPGCKTCQKAQDFFQAHAIATNEQVDAKKRTLTESDAISLAAEVGHIIAAKGTKVVRFDMQQDRPDAAAIKSVLLGPTGNLRAPTFRVGKTLVVGFHEESYREVFSRK